MSLKKVYNYQMPDWIREFISEFLGNFLQIYLVLTSLMLRFIYPNGAVRTYTDPELCYLPSNDTQYNCDIESNKTEFMGKKEGDLIYFVKYDAIYVLVIILVWGAGLLGSLLVSVPVSGGYLNPAISVTLATMSRLEWKKLLYYIPAQYLGSFFAALMFHVLYFKHIPDSAERDDVILYVLTSMPHPKTNMWTAMADSFFASAIFSLILFSILDNRKEAVAKYAQPLSIMLSLFGVILCFFADSKLPLSPARDLGTRFYAALIIGFEPSFSPLSYCFWWLPKQVCLYIGFLAGGWLYVSLFGSDINENKTDKNNTEKNSQTMTQTNGQISDQRTIQS